MATPTQHSAGQYQLTLVPHTYRGALIQQRSADGYINATAMCRASGKLFNDYSRLKATGEFLASLSGSTGIPVDRLTTTIMTGPNELRGTWVHPKLAINLATWLSADFAVQVADWVFDWMSGKGAPAARAELPFHLRRYIANSNRVPAGHFSILTELTLCLIAPLEALGYRLPEAMWPDISSGRMFAKFLRDEHRVNTDAMPTYVHVFEDGRQPVQAKAYPDHLLPHFRKHFREVWFPQRAPDYFAERDPVALSYLPKMLPRQAA